MTGSEKNRCSTSKRQNAQFATLPTRSKQSSSIPVNRNIPIQVSVTAAEVQQAQHLSIRGRKRKKQTSSINANQSSILSVPQYSTFMMPTTSNNLKETQ
ncbi:hypothetical protein WUBG_17106, partial [Wuchereria bancrofti]